MATYGANDFFIMTGSRVQFWRDQLASESNAPPLIDLGVTEQPVQIGMSEELAEVRDAMDGRLRTTQRHTTIVDYEFSIRSKNLSPEMWAILMGDTEPRTWTQTAGSAQTTGYAHPGQRMLITDSSGNAVVRLASIDAVADESTSEEITDVTQSSSTFTFSGDVTSTYTAGSKFIATGLTNAADGVYTVVSATFDSTDTDVVVSEDPGGDDSSITGEGRISLVEDTDWSVGNLDIGQIVLEPGGAFSIAGDVRVAYTLAEVSSGNRLHYIGAEVTRQGKLYWTYTRRDNAATSRGRVTVGKDVPVTMTARAVNLPDSTNRTEYATVELTFRLLEDLTQLAANGSIVHLDELPASASKLPTSAS